MLDQLSIRFSVVTVCLNAEDTIQDTIQSVIKQTYDNYEYIIMDGISTDGTLDLIKKYDDKHIILYSEKDTGLYNAMNKAAMHCNSDYIIFMNSGDCFHDKNVLQDNAYFASEKNTDIIYGNIVRQYENYTRLERYHGRNKVMLLLLMGKMPCHQAMFTRTSLMQQLLFDEIYSITADYNFLMRCMKRKCSMSYIDRTIGISECQNGISSCLSNLEEMRKQDDRSLRELYPGWYFFLIGFKRLARIFMKRL